MGVLDGIKKVVGNTLGGAGAGAGTLVEQAIRLVTASGGVNGLVEAFKKKGLGEVIASWVSTGKNLPISAEQVTKVFGAAKIAEIAKKVGISAGDASKQLSSLLPRLVDGVTPDGAVPAAGALAQRLSALKDKLL